MIKILRKLFGAKKSRAPANKTAAIKNPGHIYNQGGSKEIRIYDYSSQTVKENNQAPLSNSTSTDGGVHIPTPNSGQLPYDNHPINIIGLNNEGQRVRTNVGSASPQINIIGPVEVSGPADGTPLPSTINGPLNAGNSPITNVGAPSADSDAATKKYVDDNSGGGGTGSVKLAGDVVAEGPTNGTPINATIPSLDAKNQTIPNVAAPALATDAANKQSVEDAIDTTVLTLDGAITGSGAIGSTIMSALKLPIDVINTVIKQVGDPVNATDAANLQTVNSRALAIINDTDLNVIGDVTGSAKLGSTIMLSIDSLDAKNQTITNVALPILATDAATKSYVDNSAAGEKTIKVTGVINIDGTTGDTAITSTFSYPLNAGNSPITNVGAPSADSDAATKKYVDDNSGGGGTGSVKLAGDVVAEGPTNGTPINATIPSLDAKNQTIPNVAAPALATDAANKQSVEDAIDTTVLTLDGDVAGSDIIGNNIQVALKLPIDVKNNKIINVADPTVDTDAANKLYVDTRPAGAVNINLEGAIVGSGLSSSPINTSLNPILSDISTIAGADGGLLISKVGTISGGNNGLLITLSDLVNSLSIANTGAVSIFSGNNNLSLSGVKDPTNDYDAANQRYVLSQIANTEKTIDIVGPIIANGTTGGTITATIANPFDLKSYNIINLADPVNATDAANLQTVNNRVQTLVADTDLTIGGDVSGSGKLGEIINLTYNQLDAKNQTINNVADPSLGNQAATKNYVDSRPAGNVTLTGPVTGSGSGTINTAFASAIDINDLSLNILRTNALPFNFIATNSSVFQFAGTTQMNTDGIFIIDSTTRQLELKGVRTPTGVDHAAPKDYVDSSITSALTNIPTPTNPNDAVNKEYADNTTIPTTITRTDQVQTWDFSSTLSDLNRIDYKLRTKSTEEMYCNTVNLDGEHVGWRGRPNSAVNQFSIIIYKGGSYYYPLHASYNDALNILKLESSAEEVEFIAPGGTTIKGVKTPGSANEAVNKQYVDDIIENAWTFYIANITGTISNPIKGNIINDQAYYMKIGKMLFINYKFYQSSGNPSSGGGGTYLFSIPDQFTIDTNVAPTASTIYEGAYSPVGNGRATAGTAVNNFQVGIYNNKNVFLYNELGDSSLTSTISSYYFSLVGPAIFQFSAQIPIL